MAPPILVSLDDWGAMGLNAIERDRALGAIFASAAGDALGANYEFKPPVPASEPITMHAGSWRAGEWTDDTAMAIVILQQLAKGNALDDETTQDAIVAGWAHWAKTAPDVGIHTRHLLSGLREFTAAEALAASEAIHKLSGKTAGNGTLMRTGPVALGSLRSPEQTAANALSLSKLTHWDDDAADACVLWSLAIRHAIMEGELDVRIGIDFIKQNRRDRWIRLIEEAEAHLPAYFSNNGWVIHAFQAAWAAIHQAMSIPAQDLEFEADRLALGLEYAVRAGFDTDTVAAIAGSMLGAYFGVTAVPAKWAAILHGQPLSTVRDLRVLANLALNDGLDDNSGWPSVDHLNYSHYSDRFEFARFPLDEGLFIGGFAPLLSLPKEITAVVSLCRLGQNDVPQHVTAQHEVYLKDRAELDENQNLEFTFATTAALVKQLRDEGHQVYLHCVQAHSRTPSVALTYAVRELGHDLATANQAVKEALPYSSPNPRFERVLREILS